MKKFARNAVVGNEFTLPGDETYKITKVEKLPRFHRGRLIVESSKVQLWTYPVARPRAGIVRHLMAWDAVIEVPTGPLVEQPVPGD